MLRGTAAGSLFDAYQPVATEASDLKLRGSGSSGSTPPHFWIPEGSSGSGSGSGSGSHELALSGEENATSGSGEEWKAKYERLFESHKKLQKMNCALEDKLLRIVEKFETEKNQMSRDLALQTQKLVQAKLTVQQLHDQNQDLESDLHLSINLLRNNRPSNFMSKKLESLPADLQPRVKSCLAEQKAFENKKCRPEGRKITVAVPPPVSKSSGGDQVDKFYDDDDNVSAAILAKVLEERDKERRKEHKFCIDVGTQTHGWHFPTPGSACRGKPSGAKGGDEKMSGVATSSSSSSTASSSTSSPLAGPDKSNFLQPVSREAAAELATPQSNRQLTEPRSLCGNLHVTSVILPPPPDIGNHEAKTSPGHDSNNVNRLSPVTPMTTTSTVAPSPALPPPPPLSRPHSSLKSSLSMAGVSASAASSYLTRSATFSSMQTDI